MANSPYIGRGHDGWLPSDGPSLSLVLLFLCLSSCSEDRAIFKLGEGVYFVHVIFVLGVVSIFVLGVVSRLGVIFKFLVNF